MNGNTDRFHWVLCKGKQTDYDGHDNGKGWVSGFFHWTDWVNGRTGALMETTYSILPVGAQDACRVDPDTICQCIGILPKTEQYLFENDIVELASPGCASRRYLLWRNRDANCMTAVDLSAIRFDGADYYDGCTKTSYGEFCHTLYGCEASADVRVIGNAIDHPELIFGKEQEYER